MSGNHKKVCFDVLTPVNFLSRAASIYFDKVAFISPNIKTVVNICDVSNERPLKGCKVKKFQLREKEWAGRERRVN